MEDTWEHKLMDVLQQAKAGNTEVLEGLLQKYPGRVVVNDSYSVLLLLRHFRVQLWNTERRVLNAYPDGPNFQWGITIVTRSEDSAGQANVYLPNNRTYTGLKITGDEVVISTENGPDITTNVTELFRKLKFWLNFEEQALEDAFAMLSNQLYEAKSREKPEVKNRTLQVLPGVTVEYNEKTEYYEGDLEVATGLCNLRIAYAEPAEMTQLLTFIRRQLDKKFYENTCLAMETPMLALKNDIWLGEDEDTGEEESPVTPEEFRARISMEAIVFCADYSCHIYCHDDDMFLGHAIEIRVDKKGAYKNATLIG